MIGAISNYSWKIGVVLFLFAGSGCKKIISLPTFGNTSVSSEVFASDGDALAAVYGIYSQILNLTGIAGVYGIGANAGLSADELQPVGDTDNPDYLGYYANAVPTTSVFPWAELYNKIYACNSSLQGINASTGMTTAAKRQLTGELKFLRAFCYFYLVNCYGDVPYPQSLDVLVNNGLSRTPAATVYDRLTTDLTDAENQLGNDYTSGIGLSTPHRLTANKQVVASLLSRVYLYRMNWQQAEQQASLIITDPKYRLEGNLDSVFLAGSQEAIWQLQASGPNLNSFDAYMYVLIPGFPPDVNFPGSLSPFLVNAFERGDQRRMKWVGEDTVGTMFGPLAGIYYYPYKYKVAFSPEPIELLDVFRLAEQYLIRAEARAQQGNIASAAADLNMIRNRAGLPNTTAADEAALLNAIYHERQVELFTEWGHRWFDLKRTGRIDTVMPAVCAVKGTTWNSSAQLYPIPLNDIQVDPHLIQNIGY